MMTIGLDAVSYYQSRAAYYRLEAEQVQRPRLAKMLLELAAAFDKQARDMAQVLGEPQALSSAAARGPRGLRHALGQGRSSQSSQTKLIEGEAEEVMPEDESDR